MNKMCCLILMFLTYKVCEAQNSVPNGGFEQGNKSVILINVKHSEWHMTELGGKLKIKNINSNETYSKSTHGYNSFVIITDIPYGNYVVEELWIGAIPILDSAYFNVLQLNESKIYYLGNYVIEKAPPLLKLNFQITKKAKDEENKIYKKVKKRSEVWLNVKIDYDQQLFKRDSLNIK